MKAIIKTGLAPEYLANLLEDANRVHKINANTKIDLLKDTVTLDNYTFTAKCNGSTVMMKGLPYIIQEYVKYFKKAFKKIKIEEKRTPLRDWYHRNVGIIRYTFVNQPRKSLKHKS